MLEGNQAACLFKFIAYQLQRYWNGARLAWQQSHEFGSHEEDYDNGPGVFKLDVFRPQISTARKPSILWWHIQAYQGYRAPIPSICGTTMCVITFTLYQKLQKVFSAVKQTRALQAFRSPLSSAEGEWTHVFGEHAVLWDDLHSSRYLVFDILQLLKFKYKHYNVGKMLNEWGKRSVGRRRALIMNCNLLMYQSSV